MHSQAGEHNVGPTIKVQHRNKKTVSIHIQSVRCILLVNCGQSGEMDNRSRWLKRVSVSWHRSLLLI